MNLSIANYITSSRIIGTFCLLTLDVTPQIASPFWGLYAFCGMTDIVDGYVARRLKAETKVGAMLDSYADIAFVVCSAVKLHPFLIVPLWLWAWAGIIVAVKIMNQISACIIHRKFVFPHTFANKLTGFCLFISIPFFVCFGQFLPLLITSFLAMFAAVQEGYYVKRKNEYQELDDRDVANILGITPGTLRTRTSRLCAKVKRLVSELNDALISALDKQSLEIAKEIYAEPEPDMESILEELLGQAERELDQYEQIIALRKEKRLSAQTFELIAKASIPAEQDMCAPMPTCHAMPSLSFDMCSQNCDMPTDASEHSTRIIRMFKQLIGM